MILILIQLVNILEQLFVIVLLIYVVLSYVMSPFHQVRQQLNRIVEPFLAPIRRLLPSMGMFDFSPLVLLILVQIIGSLAVNILRSLL
ncbi:MAG: YggT family protein [Chloroflexi bacterium]|nr:YggT family protein [Chloroflexota bacterium]